MKEKGAKSIYNILSRINLKLKLLKLINHARAEYDKHNYNNCLEDCKKALEINSENPIALRGMGCVMQISGDNTHAVEYYKKALQYSANKEIEYTLLGTIYYNLNDLDTAIKYFNLAIEENGNYEVAYEGRNQSMLEQHLQILDLQDKLISRKIFK